MRGRKPATILTSATACAAVPSPPAWLGKDARAEWRRIMPDLVARRVLTEADLGNVENYCLAIGTVREAQRAIARDGLTYVSGNGLMKANPALGVQDRAMTTARLLAAELGLTPVSRSRPAIREDAPADADPSPLDL